MKIVGSITLKKRQKIISEMAESDNCVLVGSFGCVGTGLTFNRVNYGIFAQSFSSDIISKQSLGRLMLKQEDKQKFYLYDIIDVYPTKKLYNQGADKIKTYKAEKHEYFIEKMNVEYIRIKLD